MATKKKHPPVWKAPIDPKALANALESCKTQAEKPSVVAEGVPSSPSTTALGAVSKALHPTFAPPGHAPSGPKVEMSPTFAGEELMKIIRQYSPAFQGMAAEVSADDASTEKEQEYVAPTLEVPDGMVSLACLIKGCKDIPVRVFRADEWPEEIRSYIPDTLPNNGKWHWSVPLAEDLAFALYCGDRTLLHGPTGSGKSAIVEAWCFLTQTPLIRVNCHREMQSTDFLGKDIIKSTPQGPVLEYDWSLTTLAAKHGGILLIDEAFRSPHLMAIQSLLERNGTLTLPDAASLKPSERKIVPPEGRSWVVLTDNSVGTGDDSGAYMTEVQDVSTLDRITAAIHVDYTEKTQEIKELAEDFPAVPVKMVLEPLISWAGKVRNAFKTNNMQQTVSRRAINAIMRKYMITGNIKEAATLSFVNKLNQADCLKAGEAWMQVFGEELITKSGS